MPIEPAARVTVEVPNSAFHVGEELAAVAESGQGVGHRVAMAAPARAPCMEAIENATRRKTIATTVPAVATSRLDRVRAELAVGVVERGREGRVGAARLLALPELQRGLRVVAAREETRETVDERK